LNRLIDQLQREGTLSLDALRNLYRSLALKCHPDVTKQSDNQFIQLQSEYEDAVRQLLEKRDFRSELSKGEREHEVPRTAFLRTLYLYSIVYDRRYRKDIFALLLRSAQLYHRIIGDLINQYGRTFSKRTENWKAESAFKDAHNCLILAIKQLGSYFENDVDPNKRLLHSYIDELLEKAKHLDRETADCLNALGRYLRQESNGPKVHLMSI
jgi:hypothetical protein